jgi:hypothetical protein
MRNTIVVGLKERKQKARNIILEADKQIKEAALEFPDRHMINYLQLEKTQQMVQEIHLPIPNSLASSNIEQ